MHGGARPWTGAGNSRDAPHTGSRGALSGGAGRGRTVTRPRLLLGASEVSTVGGSATASYDLFRRMVTGGHDAHFVSLSEGDDVAYYERVVGPLAGNPARLPNVHHCRLRGRLNDPHPELTAIVDGIDPDALAGFGLSRPGC